MAYQALYRKYRPAAFEDMAGQKQIVRTLQNAIESDRISHAYLFCGPRGTGKTSAAKIFARALNCTGEGSRPCGKCENCLAADHPDIIEIDAASNNGVEEARNLVERVKYAPMLGKYKVYIIDEVHMMTAGAFNALLKTIEEPPAHVVFILATTEPHKVLPTILSRCQRFDFKKVPDAEIRKRLVSVAEKEGTVLDEDAAAQISLLAEGGMRDALSILDQCIAYEPEHLKAEDIRAVYGVVSPEDTAGIIEKLAAGNAQGVMNSIKEIYDNGMDLERFTAGLITMIKDSLILQYSPDTTLLSDERKHLISETFLASSLSWRRGLLKELMDVYPQFSRAFSVLDYLESVLLRYADSDMNTHINLNTPKSESVEKAQNVISDHSDLTSRKKSDDSGDKKSDGYSQSDVSRETSLKEEKRYLKPEKIRYSTEEIVGLLHAADRSLREKDMTGWMNRNVFNSSLQYGKFARQLETASLVASGKTYMIVHTARQLDVDALNDLQRSEGFEEFLEKLTGSRRILVAISTDDYKEAVALFRDCMKRGEFPSAPVVTVKGKTGNHMKSEEEDLKEVFPNLKIIND